MQVPLDPADFGGPGVEGLGAGLGQLADPQRQFGLLVGASIDLAKTP